MIQEISISVLPGEEDNTLLIRNKVLSALGGRSDAEISALVLKKKSIDARHGRIKIQLRYAVYIGENPATGEKVDAGDSRTIGTSGSDGTLGQGVVTGPQSFKPAWRQADPARRVITSDRARPAYSRPFDSSKGALPPSWSSGDSKPRKENATSPTSPGISG